jgi:hypothetical protein
MFNNIFLKNKIKKLIEKELRKCTGHVNDYITRRIMVCAIHGLLKNSNDITVVCNDRNNTTQTVDDHKLIVDVFITNKFHLISEIGPSGKVTHQTFDVKDIK